jgi:23S rRNA G2445 N2-methylase RlmL
MIRDTFDKIREKADIRENLIKLKAELKETHSKTALLYYIGADYQILLNLLKEEDPKIRKNTALILGELNIPETLNDLYEAYENEEQLFVRSAYLTALKNFDYTAYVDNLERRYDILSSTEITEGNKKHVEEELRHLSALIRKVKGAKKHEFTGYKVPASLILLTNRNYIGATLKQLQGINAREFNAGVMVECDDLEKVLSVRTYTEILFILKDIKSVDRDVVTGAKALAESSLMEFLMQRHQGNPPFYFRIELKAKMELDKRSSFTKKFASELERNTGRKLINSTSDYEWELRLIENKEGRFNVLIKLCTLKDDRFGYRKNVIAASINPAMAALIAALAKDYMKEDGQVLDPFCGVGTMLIERNQEVKAGTMYGLDVFGQAIERAKENTALSGDTIYFINRNFFDFKHEYLFDEIITNMPRAQGHKDENEICELYRRFFVKAGEHLNEDGVIIMYSHNKDYVHKFYNRKNFRIVKEFEISKREGAYLFILQTV